LDTSEGVTVTPVKRITVTLVKTSKRARQFNLAEELPLVGVTTQAPITPYSDTFGPLSRLSPGSGVDGALL
jgi:hypothetical protein